MNSLTDYPVFYSHHFTLPLPEEHRFPIEKYKLLHDYLLAEGILKPEQMHDAPLATPDLLAYAHDPEYVEAMRTGTIDEKVIKRIGFPWSQGLYLRSCATVGGAWAAAQAALRFGISGCLAGGTHHAHRDRGEGYCVFNDLAVVSLALVEKGMAKRVMIIDLDVHQGNGNSSILSGHPHIFVASVHGDKNYPFKKVPSHLDIALPDGASDRDYLAAVDEVLKVAESLCPDFILYQMGVDPLKEDTLGRLAVTHDGLIDRDRKVLDFAKKNQIPISLALGGGYAKPIQLSVLAYANTYRVVNQIYMT